MDDNRKKPARAGAGKGGSRTGGKPFAKRDGDRPFAKRDGDAKPYAKRAEGGKPFVKRDGDKPRGDRKPFAKQDGDRKPFVKRDGDRPFAKRDGDQPFVKRDGEKKPFVKRDGASDSSKRPGRFERGQGGDRPFRERAAAAGKPSAIGDPAASDGERIAKRLARAGVASRRDAEEMIAAGRVAVNGKVLTSPAFNVSPGDRIELDGDEIPAVERTRLFLFHKPAGVVTTNKDPEGRKTVFDILPDKLPRLMTIGRLDINTEGLLLLTNDGGLSRVLELPATGWLRRYRVRVHGKVDAAALEGLKEGVAVDGVFYGAVEAALDREQGSNAWLTIGLREGKNREVKNILGALGLDVTRLIRVSYGPFQLGDLAEGEVRELRGRHLRDQLGQRLIEEAGADFEAPIRDEFSNKPVAARPEPREERPERPNRKRQREEKREDALGRLQTKPAPGGKGKPRFGKPEKRGEKGREEKKPFEPPRSRSSNVWMAPGARPLGEKKAAELAERNKDRRFAGKPRPAGKPAQRKPRGPK